MLINSFLTYLRCELNRSAHTVLSYHTDILQFARFITGDHPDQFRPELTEPADLRSWTLRLAQSGVSLRSIRRKVSSLSALFRYLMQRGLMTHNPAREIPPGPSACRPSDVYPSGRDAADHRIPP